MPLSIRNSTHTALDAAGVFTGGADEVVDYSTAVISVFSDQDGSFTVEGSLDSENWDSLHASETYTAGAQASEYTISIPSRYFRIVYTNGGVAQTVFRLACKFIKAPGDVTVAASALPAGAATEATLLAIEANTAAGGTTKYSPPLSLAAGEITDSESVAVWGYGVANNAAPTLLSSIRVLGDPYAPSTLPRSIRVVSNSPDDASGLSGAHTLVVDGINSSGARASEAVTMNGLTPVGVPGLWRRVNSLRVTSAGAATMNNAGTIIAELTSGGTTLAAIQPGEGQSNAVQYRAPDDRRMFLKSLNISANSLGAAHIMTIWCYDLSTGTKRMVFKAETDDGKPQKFELGMQELPYGAEVGLTIQTTSPSSMDIWGCLEVQLAD
jgi:hypothetical protein